MSNNEDIKKLIKPLIEGMVREALLKIFAEMKLETLIENAVNKQQRNSQAAATVMSENIQASKVSRPSVPKPNKRSLMEAIGVNENTWNDVYADTLKHGNSVLTAPEASPMSSTPQAGGFDDREDAPVSALEQLGLIKDYSRFVK